MIVVIFAALIDIVDKTFDAQRLQNVSEVLLQCLLAVLVGKQNACFGLGCGSPAEFVEIEDTACQVGRFGLVRVQNDFHVGTRVEILYDYSLAFHALMLSMKQLATESTHGLQRDITADNDVSLLARIRIPTRSILALLAMQLKKFASLLRDHNQRANHDDAVEDFTIRRLRITESITIPHRCHRNDREVNRLDIISAKRTALNV